MGSSGSDRFSDYSGSPSGVSKEEPCKKAFSASLEDVATSEYFKKKGKVPAVTDELVIDGSLVGGRIVVKADELIVGNLPTKFNYLLKCFTQGISYSSTVSQSGLTPIPFVKIDASPNE